MNLLKEQSNIKRSREQSNGAREKMKLNKKFDFKNILKSVIQVSNEVTSTESNNSRPFSTADQVKIKIEGDEREKLIQVQQKKNSSDITSDATKSYIGGDMSKTKGNSANELKSNSVSEKKHLSENGIRVATGDMITIKKYNEENLSRDGVNGAIKQMENDLNALKNDVFFKKMHPKKLKFNKRRYKLDMKHRRLVASTRKCCMRERVYEFEDLCEINNGAGSVNLQAFKNKNQNKMEEIDNLAFEITYDNYKKSLNLMANNQLEKNRWINALSSLIKQKNKNNNTDWTKDDNMIKVHFLEADKGNDKSIDLNEIDAFLESMNLKLKKEHINTLLNQADKNKDGKLTEEEFKQFVTILFHRKEMLSLFNMIASEKSSKILPNYLDLKKFQYFLKNYQKEQMTNEQCIELINKYEVDVECKKKKHFSYEGFVNYLNDEEQHINNKEREQQVYQDMELPIFSYYISSSHNTYLTGDQLTSESKADCYRAAIMNGARLVEMDVYDGADNEPRIYHQKTLTSKMKFADALLVIREYAFKISDFPLIITIELHCSPEQQKVMAVLIKKYIGDYLYAFDFDNMQKYPTLNELKRKIIIRSQLPKVKKAELANVMERAVQDKLDSIYFDEFEEQRESEIVEIAEFSSLVNLMQNVTFKGVEFAFDNYNQNQTSSLSEKKCDDFIEKENPLKIIDYTNHFLSKVYPAFFRTDSSNLNPLNYWNLGFQIAALNFQTEDNQMSLNKAMFNDNGGCGFVLKPEILRNPLLGFNPNDVKTMMNRRSVEIRVISALNLPQNDEILIRDISDPFVTVNIYGLKMDLAEKKTKAVQDNGFNPIWNESFKFVVNCPELAFLKFTVKDEDIGKDQFIGDYTIRFSNIKAGYRHIKLNNNNSQGILFVGIKIKPYTDESIKDKIRTVKDIIDEAEEAMTKLTFDENDDVKISLPNKDASTLKVSLIKKSFTHQQPEPRPRSNTTVGSESSSSLGKASNTTKSRSPINNFKSDSTSGSSFDKKTTTTRLNVHKQETTAKR